mmetsp:Transcript_18078/g.50594  ORF Transcript_18078/g.50594 Transcript_18078/m.50594 type:complete len:200 (-) Transcript_18078:738-1337(-)
MISRASDLASSAPRCDMQSIPEPLSARRRSWSDSPYPRSREYWVASRRARCPGEKEAATSILKPAIAPRAARRPALALPRRVRAADRCSSLRLRPLPQEPSSTPASSSRAAFRWVTQTLEEKWGHSSMATGRCTSGHTATLATITAPRTARGGGSMQVALPPASCRMRLYSGRPSRQPCTSTSILSSPRRKAWTLVWSD